MIGAKMLRVLTYLKNNDVKLMGVWIGFSYATELQISLNSQPQRHVHDRLRAWGFINNENEPSVYIYRPPR